MNFVLILTEHRLLGVVLFPYMIKPGTRKDSYTLYERLTTQSVTQYGSLLSPEDMQIVQTIENYNDQNLHKLFCKKKKTVREFVEDIDKDLFSDHVRPYIEKQITRCYEILQYNYVPVYQKFAKDVIYESDRTEIIQEDCETVFNFTRHDQGIQYFLSIEHENNNIILTGNQGIIPTNNPCSLLLKNKLFVFQDIDGKKLLPFFNKEFVSIPKSAEEKYFNVFIKKAIAKYKVNANGFTIQSQNIIPKPVISLENDLRGYRSLVLRFVYGDNQIYYANKKTGKRVELTYSDKEVSFTTTLRDYTFENSTISKLLTYGLKNVNAAYFEPLKSSENNNFGVITWLNQFKKILVTDGFEVIQKVGSVAYYLDSYELKIDISDKSNDWFDITAIIEFDDFQIPFIEFKSHIIDGIREYVLPDDRVMILPEEWFDTYGDLMKFSKKEGKQIKLQKQHFSIINAHNSLSTDDFKTNLMELLKSSGKDLETIPESINAKLRGYQHEGYTWMYRLYKNGFGGCLADDMGLGKTLQTITLLNRTSSENKTEILDSGELDNIQLDMFAPPPKTAGSSKTSLVVVPTSLIYNWKNEIKKFSPSLIVKTYYGPSRGNINELYKDADILLTSYGLLRNDISQFRPLDFLYVILDESQVIKNPTSKTYKSVIQLKAQQRLVLSGTPIENSLSDLWSQFNFINPGLLGNLNFFQQEFQTPIEKNGDEQKQERLKQLISPFLLRRTKQQVAKELPPLTEQLVTCPLDSVQEVLYEKEKARARKVVLENINAKGIKKATVQILQSLIRMRQIANHPLMVDENYLSGSGKFDEIKRHIQTLNEEGHKALLFSSFVKHIDLVGNYLDSENIHYARLTGETTKREEVVDEFQNNDDCKFFLVSLKAGGVGLNLTAASYVLMLDPWWNPAAERQAINRAHRIGQDKHVMVYRFISENTLEEKIIKLQERKSDLADMFVNENSLSHLLEDELMDLFE